MQNNLLQGALLCLVAEEPEEHAEAISRWNYDTEWWRLLAAEPSNQHSVEKIRQWIDQDQQEDDLTSCSFAIRTLDDNRLIGFIGLEGDLFPHGEAFVGIGIGVRESWGKGYGTDAMKIILHFAFQELNLRRVSLDTFEYNPRAIHSYEKVGFVHEGRVRDFLNREGKRWDLIFMGILEEEWLSTRTT
jgi:RimJ/RimL family protein N-acetyltransferase